MESGLSTVASTNTTFTVDLQAFADDFGGGDLLIAARRFDAVRYIVVACATIALMDRLLITKKEISRIWSGPMTIPKVFYFLNRYSNLCCVGLDVFVFTQRIRNPSDCVWWFTFRTWASVIISTILEALLIFKLWILFGKCKYIFFGFSGLSIAQTIGTSFLVRPRLKYVEAAPIPGEWFAGCSPLFTDPRQLSHEWVSLTAVISAMALAAILWTIGTWRRGGRGLCTANDASPASTAGSTASSSPPPSLWNIAKQNSILHILGLCLTTLFCAIFFLRAPQPLSSIVPSVSSTMFSVFGCRIAIDMPEYAKCDLLRTLPALPDYELEEVGRRSRIKRATAVGDLEAGLMSSDELKKKATVGGGKHDDGISAVSNLECERGRGGKGSDISPLSQAATLVPVPAILNLDGAVQPTGEFRASEVTLSLTEANSNSQPRPRTQTTTAESRRSTLVGGATRPSIDRSAVPPPPVPALSKALMEREARGASSTSAKADVPVEVDDDDDDLDRKLAEEYDDEGRKRPPRRTHQRKWRSEADYPYLGLPHTLYGQGFLMPRQSSAFPGRPASAIHYSQSRHFASSSKSAATSPRSSSVVFPPETPPPSGSVTPSRRSSASRSMSPHARMSYFFQRRRSAVGSIVPEGEVPRSFSPPTTSIAEEVQAEPPSRRHSTSSSRSRVRRSLISGPSSPTSASHHHHPPTSPTSPLTISRQISVRRARRESDAMSVCTTSTDFAFDNSGTFEAPDFN